MSMQTLKTVKASPATTGQWFEAREMLPEPEMSVAIITVGGKRGICECSSQTTRAVFIEDEWKIVWYFPVPKGSRRDNDVRPLNKIVHWMYLPVAPIQLVRK